METLWLFALLVFGIIAVPGMDMAFVLSSALADGRRGGFAALAGIVTGGFAHVLMGALGVGLLESFGSFYASAFKEVIVFSAILPVLLWRSLSDPHSEEH